MTEFKQGQMIEVSNYETFPKKHSYQREFVWGCDTYWCISGHDKKELSSWTFARVIPEKKYRSFAFDTFPKQLVFARIKDREVGERASGIVNAHKDEGILVFDCTMSYEYAFNIIEISLDGGKTWQPCGEEL
jgi:hypothetical protein